MVNYRCKNQRKNEHILETNFCNSLIKKSKANKIFTMRWKKILVKNVLNVLQCPF